MNPASPSLELAVSAVPFHPAEEVRLAALRAHHIVDTPPEREFDEVVALLAEICTAPVALITLIGQDRQWFKAKVGLDGDGTPRDQSICAHAILGEGTLVVPDVHADPRFAHMPSVNGDPPLKFYAGVPLRTAEGLPLGTLCVLDHVPRQLNAFQLRALEVLARQVMVQLRLRRALQQEHDFVAAQDRALQEKEGLIARNAVLVREVDHRVKNSLQLVGSLLSIQARRSGDPATVAAIEEARSRVLAVADVHEQLHQAARVDRVPVGAFLEGLCRRISTTKPDGVDAIVVQAAPGELSSEQVLTIGLAVNEMILNAFKHAFPDGRHGAIRVDFTHAGGTARLAVADNGVGMAGAPAAQGLGLRLLSALAAQLGGTLDQGIEGAHGTRVALSFPYPETAPAAA
jgi:two-component sensor histidine kinase